MFINYVLLCREFSIRSVIVLALAMKSVVLLVEKSVFKLSVLMHFYSPENYGTSMSLFKNVFLI